MATTWWGRGARGTHFSRLLASKSSALANHSEMLSSWYRTDSTAPQTPASTSNSPPTIASSCTRRGQAPRAQAFITTASKARMWPSAVNAACTQACMQNKGQGEGEGVWGGGGDEGSANGKPLCAASAQRRWQAVRQPARGGRPADSPGRSDTAARTSISQKCVASPFFKCTVHLPPFALAGSCAPPQVPCTPTSMSTGHTRPGVRPCQQQQPGIHQ